jgi:hypothetical protein
MRLEAVHGFSFADCAKRLLVALLKRVPMLGQACLAMHRREMPSGDQQTN